MIDREMYEAAFAVMARSRAFLAPPVELSVSEWSDRFAVLSRESSSQHGKYDSRVTPYLREPMNVFSDKTIRRCVLMFASQLGKTTAINLMISRAVDLDPSPIIFVLPSLSFADSYAKTRIEPMFRDTPRLRGLLADKSANTGKNKLREKMFPGGYLVMVGSESTTELAGRPCKRAYLDEVDRLARNREGDVVQLVRVRLSTFFDSEEVITSTPTIDGSSRIVTEYEAGTQEKYWIPCPLCNKYQILSFWRLTDEPVPQHTCEHCQRPSRQNEWLAQSHYGEWRPERTTDADGLPLTVRSFWLDCMVSPWLSWRDIREEYRVAKELNDVHRSPEKLVTFYNTRLCQPWKDMSGQRADADALYDRLEAYNPEGTEFDLPDPVRVVTCGVDTQDDRLEYTIYGYGAETEMWGIEHGIIWGDTTDQDVWNQLTAKVYNRELTYADGVRKKIDKIFIDRGGHRAEQVDRWVKHKQPRVYPTKGNAGWGKPFVMSFVPTYVGDLRVPMLNIGTDGLKAHLLTCLKIEEPGPAFVHYGREDRRGFTKEFFAALCSERCVTEYKRGQPVRYWSKEDRAKNEAWDTLCYAYAACWELLKYDGMCRGLERARRVEGPASVPAYQNNGAAKGYQPITQQERKAINTDPTADPQQQKSVPRWMKNNKKPQSTRVF